MAARDRRLGVTDEAADAVLAIAIDVAGRPAVGDTGRVGATDQTAVALPRSAADGGDAACGVAAPDIVAGLGSPIGSVDPLAVWHAELGHGVEDPAAEPASRRCPARLRALMCPPRMLLYLNTVFSTRLRWLYPDAVCHSRRPSLSIERMLRFLCFIASDGSAVNCARRRGRINTRGTTLP